MRLYRAPGHSATVLLGGAGGGFDSPAKDLYGTLARELPEQGITILRLRYRDPSDLDAAVYDVLTGLSVLAAKGIQRVGQVGHSFGGAVAIRVAVRSPEVAAVVCLATQAYGTESVGELSPRPLLLIHGMADEILPAGSSTVTFRRANKPKELRLIDGARHSLDEASDEVRDAVRSWLVRYLEAEPVLNPN